jgi:hypothetical protein
VNRSLIVLLTLIIVAVGCSKRSEQSGHSEDASKASATHAAPGVVPGSYEDWCEEHQVPESACTRCDPSLIPAFKATKDWCEEHGLPESQCFACNPNLKIVRPPKPEGR